MPYDRAPDNPRRRFQTSYQITLEMAEQCIRESGVKVFVTLGPYPVLLIDLAKEHGLEVATQMMKEGMESAARLVRERKAIAIGEVGRPHFEVPTEIMAASNEILSYGMSLAKEASCPIVIHAETATPETMEDLGRMADKVGLDRGKVVKHYSPSLVLEEENRGLMASVLASRSSRPGGIRKRQPFLGDGLHGRTDPAGGGAAHRHCAEEDQRPGPIRGRDAGIDRGDMEGQPGEPQEGLRRGPRTGLTINAEYRTRHDVACIPTI